MINISDVQKFSHLQLQIPSSRTETLFLSGAGTAMQRWITRHIFQRPLDSTVLTGEFKYRRVRISPVLIRNS